MNTILVIEDNDDDYFALKRLFERAGVQNPLLRCTCGEDALECLAHCARKRSPGLILLDLNMPDIDGREILSSLRASPEFGSVPVIVLTTSCSGEDVRRCYDTGADAYLFKPLEMGAFAAALDRIREEKQQAAGFVLETSKAP
jgi:CheY-like chemotaxis protein